ncbi:12077_t:CDS:2, partial [Acaulospora colombiana]
AYMLKQYEIYVCLVYDIEVKVNTAGVEAYPSGRAQSFAGGLPIGLIIVVVQNAHRDYELRLRQALQETPQSEKLLNLKRGWESHEYDEDWAWYEDEKIIRKADKKVKRGKLKAHVAFNENLDERPNIKKPSDKLASSSKDHGEVPKKTTNRQFKNQIGDTNNKENEDGIEEVNEVSN